MQRNLFGAVALVVVMALPNVVNAQLDEYGVKASFIRNFVAFVEWPDARLAPDGPLVICVFNESPITARLTELKIPPIRNHHVQVRSITALPDLGVCHAVFVPLAEAVHVADIQSRYRDAGMLTITETTRERTGAVINMFVNQSRMAFDVDLDAAKAQTIRVSSKLLALAHEVHGKSKDTGSR